MWYVLFWYRILELFSHFNKTLTGYISFTSILFIQMKVIKHKNKKLIKKKKNTQSTKHQNN